MKDLKNFKYFHNLLILSLSLNKLRPQTLLDLPSSIQKLDISHNQIHSLSTTNGNIFISVLQNLVNLEEIDISFNNIDKLDERTFNLNFKFKVNPLLFFVYLSHFF